MFMSFLVNTTTNYCRRIPDVSLICLLLKFSCIDFSYLVLSEPLIQTKQIGFIPLYTPPVTSHLLACRCPSIRQG
ncbi:hypothetical protein NC652_009396 [Populus alba x Populus x berolinensis]|nr:hypothetical protein NC652_009396 [Populus alba x Populus x berolinensis]